MFIINIGILTDGEEMFSFVLQSLTDYFYLEGNVINGYLIAYLSLNTLWVHIPILIIIVTTHIFSSEFEYGTIKVMLTQPVSRIQVILSKIFTMTIFNFLFMVIVAIFALFPSIWLFGSGDVMVFIDGIQFILEETFMKRFMGSILFSVIAMLAFSSLSMFFALWFRNTLTTILVSFGILIVFTLFQTFVFGMFSSWQPFLFTYHISKWQLFFMSEIPKQSILNSIYFLSCMSLVFILLSIFKFKRMRITE